MTHLGDAAQDAERWWRAYRLAENDKADELREHAEAGDNAREFLAENPDWQHFRPGWGLNSGAAGNGSADLAGWRNASWRRWSS